MMGMIITSKSQILPKLFTFSNYFRRETRLILQTALAALNMISVLFIEEVAQLFEPLR